MKKAISLFLTIIFLTGCSNLLTTTGTSGTSFGMEREAVLKSINRKKYKIISQDENSIVVDGLQEQLKQPAIKTFRFENDRLVSVTDQIK